MGDKHQAKEFAKSCGVPVLETIVESSEEDSNFEKNAKKLPLAVILKPLSGGGGKGMVIIRNASEFDKGISEGRNIAKKAFGDSRLLAEPLIEHALHIEVQIIGDQQGQVQHLYERDCTIQRRHQKIIEETPSPIIHKQVLDQIYQHAVNIAQKAKYFSLGTVEFILDEKQNFYFMEMNTRLQVEHPVTEETLGLDLVEKQIRIAQGQMLEKILPKKIKPKGHAIEVRVYTENPQANFMPSTGRVEYLKVPKDTASIRIDRGVEQGNTIHHSFDPMILKITAHASNREKAIQALIKALQETVIFGVHTNIDYLQWILQHPDFIDGKHSTTWTGKTLKEFQDIELPDSFTSTILENFEKEKMRRDADWRNDPWLTLDMHEDYFKWKNETFVATIGDSKISGAVLETLSSYWLAVHGNTFIVPKIEKTFEEGEHAASNVIRAPMTGTIVHVHAQEGKAVKKNDVLIEMEAMKMQYKIEALQDGIVEKLNCAPKEIVEQDSILIEMA
ncbi:MAG: biotin/lipoyl-containing protein [Bdellovibrionota bacterium]